MKSKKGGRKVKVSNEFVIALALVSIFGFVGIASESLFDYDLNFYVEASLMIVIGIGLIIEGQVKQLKMINVEGLTPENFTHLITVIIGAIAVISGLLSIPPIRLENQGFLAVKGILSIIAIIIIIVQTWIVERKPNGKREN